jgi:hypothetical protein
LLEKSRSLSQTYTAGSWII